MHSHFYPVIERDCSEYSGVADCIYIKVESLTIRVSVPFGHSADDISIEYTNGEDGWIEAEEEKRGEEV